MKENFPFIQTLKNQEFSKIDIDQILNYLETLDYDLSKTIYIGEILSKNERLAKYFFFRDKLRMTDYSYDEKLYLNEILDQCIDWAEFWRLLVIRKGFCCIRLSGELLNKKRYIFLSGPNILSKISPDLSHSIYED
ncbi:hypothetical protein DNJ73_00505 [Prochlorococcus marinus XMU1408]|uniref:Uncharacterized protein n=2 Tax=Prochlorococcus marinus TaxID=1219 RepID=A0A318R3T7_PROMR|nr:hypothetical protein [Prochlorococcus marinus str. XMU1408]PYE03704.1 hypothetical protein DNJ73_00505 [Prochlorococcus marinus XMU1408]